MKKVFLTSSMGSSIKINNERIPCIMDNSNKMINVLMTTLPEQKRLVIFASDPDDFKKNDLFQKINEASFRMSGFNFSEIIMIDNRNKNDIKTFIQSANLIILGGGHVPTQNRWFKEINLKKLLTKYNGIIVGMSAGSMNCSDIVYCCPEQEGEGIDPSFNRWINGLDLTDIKILPHFDECKMETLDGLKVIEDIVLPDSYKYPIYALNDGSFITIDGKEIIVHGDCSRIYKGIITKICDTGDAIIIS